MLSPGSPVPAATSSTIPVSSISCLFLTSCDIDDKRVRGNGNIITTERTVSSFSEVELFQVVVSSISGYCHKLSLFSSSTIMSLNNTSGTSYAPLDYAFGDFKSFTSRILRQQLSIRGDCKPKGQQGGQPSSPKNFLSLLKIFTS